MDRPKHEGYDGRPKHAGWARRPASLGCFVLLPRATQLVFFFFMFDLKKNKLLNQIEYFIQVVDLTS